jgi:hypothetical protein
MKDTRVAYGAQCTWWDDIDKVGVMNGGLPCCPKCKGVLMEVESPEIWWKGVDAYEAKGFKGYREFVEWGRGKCYKHFKTAYPIYHEETGKTVTGFKL